MDVKALKTHQKTSGDIKKVEASKKQMSLAKSFAFTSRKVTSTDIQCSNTTSEKDKFLWLCRLYFATFPQER